MGKFIFQNKSGETFPAYGCGRLKSILSTDEATGNPVFELVKPDGESGIYIINGPNNIVDDALGVGCSLTDATVAMIDDGSVTDAPVFGDVCGPTIDRWAVTSAGAGLRATGELNNRTITVSSEPAGSGGSSSDSCPCACIDDGDAVVNGIVTSSQWSIAMKTEIFRGEYGDIIFPAGGYTVVLNEDSTEWTLDIGDVLTAVYLDGSSATADTTMDGTLTMTWGAYGPVVTLCVEGSVPAP